MSGYFSKKEPPEAEADSWGGSETDLPVAVVSGLPGVAIPPAVVSVVPRVVPPALHLVGGATVDVACEHRAVREALSQDHLSGHLQELLVGDGRLA